MSPQSDDGLSRRKVLQMSAIGAGAASVGFAGSVTARRGNGGGNGGGGRNGRGRNGGGNGGGGKSGGRGQTSSPVELDRPFEVKFKKVITTNASCQSDNSAQQDYNRYWYRYCDGDDDWEYTFCVIPDDSDLDESRVYEFRSAQECKAPSSQFQTRFSFGPSNSPHSC